MMGHASVSKTPGRHQNVAVFITIWIKKIVEALPINDFYSQLIWLEFYPISRCAYLTSYYIP